MKPRSYPYLPRSAKELREGELWPIPLSDGRFACGRVLGPGAGGRDAFFAGVHDWVAATPPTPDAIAGAPIRNAGITTIHCFADARTQVTGHRELDGEQPSNGVYWSHSAPRSLAEHALVTRARMAPARTAPVTRSVRSPLADEVLAPADSDQVVVQLRGALTEAEYRKLAAWLERFRRKSLVVWDIEGEIRDLELLRYFPFLDHFGVDDLHHAPRDFAGIRHLASAPLRSLAVGAVKRPLRLDWLCGFRALERLVIEGPVRDLGPLGGLESLVDLTLRSVSQHDLGALAPLAGLRALDLKLGRVDDLSLLPRIGRLEYLELWRVAGIESLAPVEELAHLRSLFLQTLSRVTSLPDLSRTPILRAQIDTMKGIRDLSPLARASTLEVLHAIDMKHLSVDDFACLRGHPRLRVVVPGIGAIEKHLAVRDLLGVSYDHDDAVAWREEARVTSGAA